MKNRLASLSFRPWGFLGFSILTMALLQSSVVVAELPHEIVLRHLNSMPELEIAALRKKVEDHIDQIPTLNKNEAKAMLEQIAHDIGVLFQEGNTPSSQTLQPLVLSAILVTIKAEYGLTWLRARMNKNNVHFYWLLEGLIIFGAAGVGYHYLEKNFPIVVSAAAAVGFLAGAVALPDILIFRSAEKRKLQHLNRHFLDALRKSGLKLDLDDDVASRELMAMAGLAKNGLDCRTLLSMKPNIE